MKSEKVSFLMKTLPQNVIEDMGGKLTRRFCRILVLGVVVLLLATLSGCQSSVGQTETIVLYGFSITENVLQEEIIPAFQKDWKEKTGQEVKFITSFAGSGTITNQIVFGAPAQVAMVATELDALNISKAGLTTIDWRSFENEGTFADQVYTGRDR